MSRPPALLADRVIRAAPRSPTRASISMYAIRYTLLSFSLPLSIHYFLLLFASLVCVHFFLLFIIIISFLSYKRFNKQGTRLCVERYLRIPSCSILCPISFLTIRKTTLDSFVLVAPSNESSRAAGIVTCSLSQGRNKLHLIFPNEYSRQIRDKNRQWQAFVRSEQERRWIDRKKETCDSSCVNSIRTMIVTNARHLLKLKYRSSKPITSTETKNINNEGWRWRRYDDRKRRKKR